MITDNRNTSGFSATLFQHKESKEYVLAFRGTKETKDLVLVDGGDVVLNGIAHGQLVDLYNFWVQMNTAKDEIYQAAYYREVTQFDPEYYSDKSFTLDGITLGDSNRYIVDFKPSNELYAEDSADIIWRAGGEDEIHGGAGDDLIFGSRYADIVFGGEGTDLLNGSNYMRGADGRSDKEKALDADYLAGGADADFIHGFAGNDIIHFDRKK